MTPSATPPYGATGQAAAGRSPAHLRHAYQSAVGEPDQATVMVARYHDELRRTAAGWRITSKVMETQRRETRHAAQARP